MVFLKLRKKARSSRRKRVGADRRILKADQVHRKSRSFLFYFLNLNFGEAKYFYATILKRCRKQHTNLFSINQTDRIVEALFTLFTKMIIVLSRLKTKTCKLKKKITNVQAWNWKILNFFFF